ncbi:uncharacterized protein BDZ83DRAFT_731229, partial [Colletotrichum acutatum]
AVPVPHLKQPPAALSPDATIAQRLRAACILPHLEPKWSARRPSKGPVLCRGPRCESERFKRHRQRLVIPPPTAAHSLTRPSPDDALQTHSSFLFVFLSSHTAEDCCCCCQSPYP